MVDAAEVGAAGALRGVEPQDGDVEHAVGEHHAVAELALFLADVADFLEAEDLLVELGGLFRVFGRERDVAYAGFLHWDLTSRRWRTKAPIFSSACLEAGAAGSLTMKVCGWPSNLASSISPPALR